MYRKAEVASHVNKTFPQKYPSNFFSLRRAFSAERLFVELMHNLRR